MASRISKFTGTYGYSCSDTAFVIISTAVLSVHVMGTRGYLRIGESAVYTIAVAFGPFDRG